ncbi:signal peptidase I [Buchnera aphidicola (Chaitoregma tattakana)]|uniref:signal peptidase I n=1 Tax=Buchnera aphidicola TaxID=9 RepID=UPI0031B88F81
MSNLIENIIVFFTCITFIFWIYDKFELYFFRNKVNKNNTYDIKKIFSTFFYTFFVIFIIKSFIFESYIVKSNSMFPTLIEGDFIIVEKFSYGIKDPIFHKVIINFKKPMIGDIVTFKYPKNKNICFVKRIAATPGDIIKYDYYRKKISIYEIYNKEFYIQKAEFSKHDKVDDLEDKKNVIYKVFTKKENRFLKKNTFRNEKNVYIYIVPKNNYFVLGDNFDNSLDSRFWGFLPKENLIGKVVTIWMSIGHNYNIYFLNISLKRIRIF